MHSRGAVLTPRNVKVPVPREHVRKGERDFGRIVLGALVLRQWKEHDAHGWSQTASPGSAVLDRREGQSATALLLHLG